MNDEKLARALKSVGQSFFVKFFDVFRLNLYLQKVLLRSYKSIPTALKIHASHALVMREELFVREKQRLL